MTSPEFGDVEHLVGFVAGQSVRKDVITSGDVLISLREVDTMITTNRKAQLRAISFGGLEVVANTVSSVVLPTFGRCSATTVMIPCGR